MDILKPEQSPSKERWRLIEEVPNYEVSDSGQVRRIDSCKILSIKINHWGYRIAYLFQHNKVFARRVNRLVAIAFVPNPDKKPTVNHKDGDKLNNHFTNLEWATFTDQNLHMEKSGLRNRRSKTGYKGVYNSGSKFSASITVGGKTVGLGSYTTKEKAARAYNNAAKMFHGDKAGLNVIHRTPIA